MERVRLSSVAITVVVIVLGVCVCMCVGVQDTNRSLEKLGSWVIEALVLQAMHEVTDTHTHTHYNRHRLLNRNVCGAARVCACIVC